MIYNHVRVSTERKKYNAPQLHLAMAFPAQGRTYRKIRRITGIGNSTLIRERRAKEVSDHE